MPTARLPIDAAHRAASSDAHAIGAVTGLEHAIGAAAKGAQGAVCFSWDDGYNGCYDTLFPMLRDHYPAQRHTFAIISGAIGTGTGVNGFMDAAEILELHQAGHEIGCHAVSNVNIPTLTVEERVAQYDDSQAVISAIIGEPTTTFLYPGAFRNATTDTELYGRFERIMGGGTALGDAIPMRRRDSMFFVPRGVEWKSANHAYILDLIRLAARLPVIVNVWGHRPGTDITSSEMKEGFDIVEALGIPAITLKEAFPGQPSLRNHSAENGLTGWPAVMGTGNSYEAATVTPAPGISGTKAFKLTCGSDAGGIYAYQIVPMDEGVAYTFSGRCKVALTSGTGYARLRVQPMNHLGVNVGGAFGSSNHTATDWSQISVALTAPAGSRYARVDFILYQLTGEAWFDHLHFGPTADGVFG
jgi:peptidoglycan/xylan/chitin deacetylase (PgdA/CDA1 family)